jgi:hypothetical protein
MASNNSISKTKTPDINSVTMSMSNLHINPEDPLCILTTQFQMLFQMTTLTPNPLPLSAYARAPKPRNEDAILQYGHYLNFVGKSLANSDFPSDYGELEALGFYISDGFGSGSMQARRLMLCLVHWDTRSILAGFGCMR